MVPINVDRVTLCTAVYLKGGSGDPRLRFHQSLEPSEEDYF